MLAGVLERCMKRRGVRECDPYDWEKVPETPQSVTTSSSSAAIPAKPQQIATQPQGQQQQRLIQQPLTENNTADLDALAVNSLLNNQENLQPGAENAAGGATAQPALPEKRSPLQVAQLPDKEGAVGEIAARGGAGTAVAVNGQGIIRTSGENANYLNPSGIVSSCFCFVAMSR